MHLTQSRQSDLIKRNAKGETPGKNRMAISMRDSGGRRRRKNLLILLRRLRRRVKLLMIQQLRPQRL